MHSIIAAKVLEVVLNDQLVVLRDDGEELKIHLSSIRLPRFAVSVHSL